MHTCHKWRRIAFASQEALHLWLFCTHGTPVQKTLHFWPALPIVVEYGGSPTLHPPALEDEDNVIAALKRSDRVISISLTVTSSLTKKLFAIKKPFSQLQDLVLLSQDSKPLTLTSPFRVGQRLRRLHSTGVEIYLQPLCSNFYKNLKDLQLHGAFWPSNFPPVALKNVLCKMPQLRSLSLHFHSTAYYGFHFSSWLYEERAVLPALTRLNYRGSISYLQGILARIDAPCLEDVEITLFDDPVLAHSKLNELIDRMEMHKSHREAHHLSSDPTVLMSSRSPGAFMLLKLQSLNKPSLMQILSMAQIGLDISPVLRNDERYILVITTRPSGRMDSSHSEELVDLLNQSTGEKSFHLDANHWINIVHTSQPSRHENVLPATEKLYLPQPGPRHVFLREGVVSVMVSRRLSGHPIEVEYERPCSSINEQHELGIVYGQCKDHYLLTWF